MSRLETALRIQALLLRKGVLARKEICLELGISQATFSRAIKEVRSLLSVGQSRSTKYAIKRKVPDINEQLPIYCVDEEGKVHRIAVILPLSPNLTYLESKSSFLTSGFNRALPFWMQDLIPSGFLGRLITKRHPEMNFPHDIRLWSVDQCLRYWCAFGWDLIGNLILGERAFKEFQRQIKNPTNLVYEKTIRSQYDMLAEEVIRLGAAGSSAGGEQQKFLAVRQHDYQPVLVKFLANTNQPLAVRRRDLLIAEHVVHRVLNEQDPGSSVNSRFIESSKTCFLEIERFDRLGLDRRRGMTSLASLNYEFLGASGSWKEIVQGLQQEGVISNKIGQRVIWFHYFGQLIANTDMHPGNFSFFSMGAKLMEPTPLYDMLPMLYAPQNEQILGKDFDPSTPVPEDMEIFEKALVAATNFWEQLSKHKLLSNDFREIAKSNLIVLRELQD